MRVLITGADGFIGRALARAVAAQGAAGHLVLTDRQIGDAPFGAVVMAGDLTSSGFLSKLTEGGFDLVYHLASMPGSMAEAGHGTDVNLTAPLALAQAVARVSKGARFVFASSIAVYGAVTDTVTPQTLPSPQISYGAHKWMTEIFLTDMARRGDLSAVSLRLPGIVARPAAETGHGSAFMSALFHKIAAGAEFDCPVPQSAQCWWLSRRACVAALIHAAGLGSAQTVIQPPVLHLTIGDVAQAACEVLGQSAQITWGDDARLTSLFGTMPPLDASVALRAGFTADRDVRALVRNALSQENP